MSESRDFAATTREISKYDDVIDSRDVIARIEELEQEIEFERENDPTDQDIIDANTEELTTLKALADECEGYASDWIYGETLIRDSYFSTYAEELASDIGAISGEYQWPLNCIDWEQASRELQIDYTAVDFDGVTYWVR